MLLHVQQPKFISYHRLPSAPTPSPNTTLNFLSSVLRIRLGVRAEGYPFQIFPCLVFAPTQGCCSNLGVRIGDLSSPDAMEMR